MTLTLPALIQLVLTVADAAAPTQEMARLAQVSMFGYFLFDQFGILLV